MLLLAHPPSEPKTPAVPMPVVSQKTQLPSVVVGASALSEERGALRGPREELLLLTDEEGAQVSYRSKGKSQVRGWQVQWSPCDTAVPDRTVLSLALSSARHTDVQST